MTYDPQAWAALEAIMAEWSSTTDSYTTRINYLSQGGGLKRVQPPQRFHGSMRNGLVGYPRGYHRFGARLVLRGGFPT